MTEPKRISPDIRIPNLDEFLLGLLYAMTEEQKERIPSELLNRIYKKGSYSVDRLIFQDKVLLFSLVFKKHIAVVIEDERSSLTVEQFLNALRIEYGKARTTDVASDLQVNGAFVFGPKEVMDGYSYMRLASCTDIFRVVSKVRRLSKGVNQNNYHKWMAAMKYVTAMISAYEIHKGKIWKVHQIRQSEFYALLFFYHGEKPFKDLLSSDYLLAEAGSYAKLARAVTDCIKKGLLMRRGDARKYMCSITAEGKRRVDAIFERIINH
jgi:hypothetical protein